MFRLIKSKHGKCAGKAVNTQGREKTTDMLQAHTYSVDTKTHAHTQLPCGIMGPLLQLPHGFLSRELIVI